MTWRAGSEDLDEWLTHNSSLNHMMNMALFTVQCVHLTWMGCRQCTAQVCNAGGRSHPSVAGNVGTASQHISARDCTRGPLLPGS